MSNSSKVNAIKVAIYSDNQWGAELVGFHIMSVKVRKASRVTQAPIESGETATDYKVKEPIRISVTGYVRCENGEDGVAKTTINSLNTMILNREFNFYSVQTRDGAYNNLILQECPHSEEAENPFMCSYQLEFIEAMVVQGQKAQASNSDNDDYSQVGYLGPQKKG